jgi:hypothetical protein
MTNHGGKKLFCGAAFAFRDGLRAAEIMIGAMTAQVIPIRATAAIPPPIIQSVRATEKAMADTFCQAAMAQNLIPLLQAF